MAIFDRGRDNMYRDEHDRGRGWDRSSRDRDRGMWNRTGDEVRSWFGDDEAERRRRMDEAREGREPYRGERFTNDRGWSDRDREWGNRDPYAGAAGNYSDRYDRPGDWNRNDVYPAYRHGMGPFSGRGPRGYQRSDDRIREDVCDRLTYAPDIDATELEIEVKNCEVVLRGSVNTRDEKRRAEDIAEDIAGVRDVRNEIRVVSGEYRGGTGLNLGGPETTPSPIGESSRTGRSRNT